MKRYMKLCVFYCVKVKKESRSWPCVLPKETLFYRTYFQENSLLNSPKPSHTSSSPVPSGRTYIDLYRFIIDDEHSPEIMIVRCTTGICH